MERRSANSLSSPPRGSPSMPDAAHGRSVDGAPPPASDPNAVTAAMLAERLATFLKACFIYPDNNQRVQVTGEAVLDSLRVQFGRRPIVEVVVGSHDLVVFGSRLPLRSHAQAWLRDLFVKALIGGLEFTPAADLPALTATARRLQRALGGKDRGLAAWADPIPGVRARELIMAGGHGQEGDEVAPATEEMGGARSARTRALESTLAASSRVKRGVEALRALLPAGQSGDGAATLDVIAEIVRCLPAEANHDHAYAEVLAEKILQSTRTELLRLGGEAPAQRDAIAKTFLSIGQKLFTATVGEETAAPRSSRGHGDETITDNLEELLRDIEQLAAGMQTADEPIASGSNAEVAGIVLHTLTQSNEVDDRALLPKLVQALRGGDAGARAVLRQYVEVALRSQDADQQPSWRVLRIAGDRTVRDALRAMQLLEPESVAEHFPRTYGLFLDTLEGPDAQARLARLARLLRDEQLVAAGTWLERHDEHTEARLEGLFAAMSPRALPLCVLALRHAKADCKAQAAKFLRQAGLAGAPSVALRVIDPPTRLPREYIEELCAHVASGKPPSNELVSLSGSLTRSYIQTLAGQPENEARRIFAIQALRELPGTETRVLLKAIVTAAKGLFWKRESRAVRCAARATMAALGKAHGSGKP